MVFEKEDTHMKGQYVQSRFLTKTNRNLKFLKIFLKKIITMSIDFRYINNADLNEDVPEWVRTHCVMLVLP